MAVASHIQKYRELVINWKLRLVVSALFSILGLAFLISMTSGLVIEDFEILDQTIVGVAVFVIVIPIYLIIADLPKINEHTIAQILNQAIPQLSQGGAELILKPEEELNEEERSKRKEIEELFEDEKLYRFLPNRPITQAILVMIVSLGLTAGVYFYF